MQSIYPSLQEEAAQRALTWQAFGVSAIGARHLRERKPKQDAINWQPVSGRGRRLALAVADGHGSDPYFRSAKGANFAVQVGTDICKQFLESHWARGPQATVLEWINQELPQRILASWREAVAADLDKSPYQPQELAQMEANSAEQASTSMIPYGTTLLVVGLTDELLVALQIGDGDLLACTREGAVQHLIPPLVSDQLGQSSLCYAEQASDFRTYARPLAEIDPGLVLLCTDGYATAFTEENQFLDQPAQLYSLLRERGLLPGSEALERDVNDRANASPGDDITVGVAYLLYSG
jgi:serine/threonine protein phosphatase PrpC